MYHVVIETDVPEQDTVESVRSRMGLLNAAWARIVREADDFTITLADYERGCVELDVLTTRMRGIVDAKVSVHVRVATPPVAVNP
jgi:hypothetical protein